MFWKPVSHIRLQISYTHHSVFYKMRSFWLLQTVLGWVDLLCYAIHIKVSNVNKPSCGTGPACCRMCVIICWTQEKWKCKISYVEIDQKYKAITWQQVCSFSWLGIYLAIQVAFPQKLPLDIDRNYKFIINPCSGPRKDNFLFLRARGSVESVSKQWLIDLKCWYNRCLSIGFSW